MKAIAQFLRTTTIGGVFFLAPIVVLIVILAKAFDYAKKGLNAVFVHIPATLLHGGCEAHVCAGERSITRHGRRWLARDRAYD